MHSYEEECGVIEQANVHDKEIVSRLREYMKEWKHSKEGQSCSEKIDHLEVLIDGSSVEGLPKYKPAEKCEKITFSEIANDLVEENNLNSVKYLVRILRKCEDKHFSEEMTGELPTGIHVLCPMDPSKPGLNSEEVNGWRFYKRDYLEKLVDIMFECQKNDFMK